jgi:hypothetical protein
VLLIKRHHTVEHSVYISFLCTHGISSKTNFALQFCGATPFSRRYWLWSFGLLTLLQTCDRVVKTSWTHIFSTFGVPMFNIVCSWICDGHGECCSSCMEPRILVGSRSSQPVVPSNPVITESTERTFGCLLFDQFPRPECHKCAALDELR